MKTTRIDRAVVTRLPLTLLVTASLGAPAVRGALAQEAEGVCAAGEEAVAGLGLTSLECSSCTFYASSGTWEFSAEPTITGIEPGGPASGLLKAGDVVAAFNGELITSRKGGRLFSHLVGGEPVTLTVRRDGRVRRVELVPATRCEPAREDATRERPEGPWPDLPQGSIGSMSPDGWLGFGVSCRCSVQQLGDGKALWSFDEPPVVYSVDPGGPAADVGLRRGDVLVEIDGIPLVSDEGGRRFGEIEPGQLVRLDFERNGRRGSAAIEAAPRPDRDRVSRRNYERIQGVLAEARSLASEEAAVLERLDSLGELLALQRATVMVPEGSGAEPLPLRFAGSLGDTDIEVRASGSPVVTIVEPGRELEIRVGDTQIRIKVR